MAFNRGVARRLQSTSFDTIENALFSPPGAQPPVGRWEAVGSLGQLVFTPDGGPIRTIITGRRRIVTGSYASRKARRALPFEGMNEPAFFMHSEVDTNVADYRAQPFRFEFVLDGKKRIYIADCARLLADGSVEVVEVKNDRRALRDPDYSGKLAHVAAMCRSLGWSFRVVLREQLLVPKTLYANIVEVQSRRDVHFNASHEYVALNALNRAGGVITLGGLANTLGERQAGMAIAKAMMVERLIAIDLAPPLSPDSLVRVLMKNTPRSTEAFR